MKFAFLGGGGRGRKECVLCERKSGVEKSCVCEKMVENQSL